MGGSCKGVEIGQGGYVTNRATPIAFCNLIWWVRSKICDNIGIMFNRPGVAGPVQQSPLSFIN